MENKEYEDQIDEEVEENIERQQDAVNDYYDDDTSPTPNEKEDLYSLFWKTINIKDSSKVGNLDKIELGMLNMSVRDMQKIAIYCNLINYTEVAKWLNEQSQIVLKTSSSKKGWLTELFVSAKKYSSKEKRMGMPEVTEQKPKTFWNRFRRK